MSVAIEQVIAAIPEWARPPVGAERSPAGLTNHNYRVEVDGSPASCGSPGRHGAPGGRSRNELHNTRAAAEAGVGPRVLQHLPAWDVIVLEWLAGRTMSNEAFAEPACRRGSRRAPPAPRRPALPRRLRHVPARRALPAASSTSADPDPRRLSGALSPGAADRGGAGGAARDDRALPQRPAGRELPRRRRAAVDRRLRVQRQQRPDLRARQHRARSSAATTTRIEALCAAYFGEASRVLARSDAAADDHVRRRLDAVGGDPGRDLDDRLRLLRAGPKSAGRAPPAPWMDPIWAAGCEMPARAETLRAGPT